MSFYRNKSNVDALRRTIFPFFPPTDISFSKKVLVEKFSSLLVDSPFVAERRSLSTRASHEAEIDDVINVIDILDLQSEFDHLKFVPGNLDELPKFGPEKINIAVFVERQVLAEASSKDISSKIQQLAINQERLLLTGASIKDMSTANEKIAANNEPTSRLVVFCNRN